MKSVLIILLVLAHTGLHATPTAAQVAEYAKLAAAAAHKNLSKSHPTDGVTQSQRAYALGPQVIYEYVLAIRKDAPESHLAAWRASVRSEIFPAACAMMTGNEFFNHGLSFRYKYIERSGALLDDFTVNKASCGKLK